MVASNCTVTQVTGPATLDEYGDPSGDGETLWAGRLDGYMRRPRKGGHPVGGTGSDRENDQRLDELVVPALGADTFQQALASGASDAASRVTVEDRRTGTVVERTYELVGLDARVAGTVADSLRLTLRREA